jgi:hypothetical protein
MAHFEPDRTGVILFRDELGSCRLCSHHYLEACSSSGCSQLLILLLEVLTLGHCSNSVWDFIPVVHHSVPLKKFRLISMRPCCILRLRGFCHAASLPHPIYVLPCQTTDPAHLFCWLFFGAWACLPGASAPPGWAFLFPTSLSMYSCTHYSLVLTPSGFQA